MKFSTFLSVFVVLLALAGTAIFFKPSLIEGFIRTQNVPLSWEVHIDPASKNFISEIHAVRSKLLFYNTGSAYCITRSKIRYYPSQENQNFKDLSQKLSDLQRKILDLAIEEFAEHKIQNKWVTSGNCSKHVRIELEVFYESNDKLVTLQWNLFENSNQNKIDEFALIVPSRVD